jgi:kynurenine formamidase
MKFRTFTIGFALVLALFLWAQRRPEKFTESSGYTMSVDLTHALNEKGPSFSPLERYEARLVSTHEADGYFARVITMPEHFGTHIDAPAHFTPGRWTVDQIPSDRLIRPLVVLDVRSRVEHDPDYQVSVEDIAAWEHANGQIPQGAIVIARTGWDARWNNPREYVNEDSHGVMHFPGYSPDAARFLIEGRNVVALGIDTISVDPGESAGFPVHKIAAGHSVYNIENVANLNDAPASGAHVVVAPTKIEGGSGAPARIFVLLR